MNTRHRIVRWTFDRARTWSASVNDARSLVRRYQQLAYRTNGHRVRRSMPRIGPRTTTLVSVH